MAIKWTNNASSTLASSISAVATTITVAGGGGSLFPTLGVGDYFYASLVDSSNNLEIVKVTARTGDVMTVVRGQEGTSANAYVGGDKFELRPTAAGLAAAAEGENIVDLPISQGGTGADNAGDARANLDVVQDPGANGFMVRNGDGTSVARTIVAGGSGISVDDGDGQAGNPTVYNDGVWSLTAGTGLSVSGSTGDVTIDNDGVTSFNGQTGAVTFTADPPKVVVFTSSGTWTKQTGLKAVIVEVTGAGGGGSTRGTQGKITIPGAGGGGGGYSRKFILASALGATETVTIGSGGTASKTGTVNTDGGTGGTTSFGSHASATGGGGGQKYDAAAPATNSSVGGTAGVGTSSFSGTEGFNIEGMRGDSITSGTNGADGGAGGFGFSGKGAGSASTAANTATNSNYGGGGGGGYYTGTNNAATGANGVVVVTEFY